MNNPPNRQNVPTPPARPTNYNQYEPNAGKEPVMMPDPPWFESVRHRYDDPPKDRQGDAPDPGSWADGGGSSASFIPGAGGALGG